MNLLEQVAYLRTAYGESKWTAVRNSVRQNLDQSRGHRLGGLLRSRPLTYASSLAKLSRIGVGIAKAIRNEEESALGDWLSDLQGNFANLSADAAERVLDAWKRENGYSVTGFFCGHCGEFVIGEPNGLDEDGREICESCVDSYFVYSECMNCYLRSERAWSVYHSLRSAQRDSSDDYCTRSYGRSNFETHNSISGYLSSDAYEEACDFYADCNEEDDDDDRDDTSLVASYHSGRDIGHIPSPLYDKGKVWLGLELEIECGDRRIHSVAESINSAVNTLGHRYIRFETDGSLSNGVEIISGYTGLDTHEEWLKRLPNADLKGCKSHDTSTCGLHVHIDKANMTPFEAARLMLFIHNPANERLIRAVARRYGRNAGYAKFEDKNGKAVHQAHRAAKRGIGLFHMNEDRYEALNFQPDRTIEYRLYRGTLKVETIMACLEFTWLSYWFARQTAISHLGTEDFIKFISMPQNKKESRYLRRLLAAKGMMPAPKGKPAPAAVTTSPESESDSPPAPRSRRGEEATVAA